jgi:hypothetical protein
LLFLFELLIDNIHGNCSAGKGEEEDASQDSALRRSCRIASKSRLASSSRTSSLPPTLLKKSTYTTSSFKKPTKRLRKDAVSSDLTVNVPAPNRVSEAAIIRPTRRATVDVKPPNKRPVSSEADSDQGQFTLGREQKKTVKRSKVPQTHKKEKALATTGMSDSKWRFLGSFFSFDWMSFS